MTFPDAAPVANDGVRFAVRRAAPARKTANVPVLLLHGVPQTSSVWRDLMPLLAEDRIVIAPDLKGLGASEHRPPYDRPTLARELAALVLHVLDDMGAAGEDDPVRIDVVGHDFGGVLALALAAERPGLVRRLVVAAAPYRKVDLHTAFHGPLLALPVLPQLALRRFSFARAAYHRAWKSPTPPDPARVDADAAAYAGADRTAGMLAYYRASARAARTPAPDVVVDRALVVWGADDPALPVRIGEAVVKDLGRAGTDPTHVRMIVANGAGHFVLEEAADVVLPAITAFLRDGDTPAQAAVTQAAVTPATKTPATKTPATKTPATKTPATKTAARKVAAKKAATPPAPGATPAARAVQKAAAKKTATRPPRVAPASAGNGAEVIETPLEADPADVAEQRRDAVPPPIDRAGERSGDRPGPDGQDDEPTLAPDAAREVDVPDDEPEVQEPPD